MSNYLLTYPVDRERDRIRGVSDASIFLVKYGDFQCPRCKTAYILAKQIQRRFGTQVAFVFRHFPQSQLYVHAQKAAEVSEVAAAQGKFWQMHDFLYEHQQKLRNGELFEYAIRIEIEPTRFLREMSARVYSARVDEDIESGISSGVKSTPTFFINGVRYRGDLTFDGLFAAIESLNKY